MTRNVQLDYHAYAKFCYSYSHENLHLNWRFNAIRVAVISDPKDPTNANEEAIYKWKANRFVPELVVIAATKAINEWLENPSIPKKRKSQADWSTIVKSSSYPVPYVNILDLTNTKSLSHQAVNALVV
ncbi:hypothetical protein BGX21_005107 [Mortierella sp. AD011]|nr:hypothetical protein BGX20_003738 [Mortierella sp. AD010]KAF9403350.1 hypothetical protein BGX21_005107 [Mortierella sp. AD011]